MAINKSTMLTMDDAFTLYMYITTHIYIPSSHWLLPWRLKIVRDSKLRVKKEVQVT